MKTEVITTLPMDPKRAQELFLFTTPFAAHLIAKATGRELYLPINRVGEADSVQATPYEKGLVNLGIRPYTLSYDDDPLFLEWMKGFINEKYASGELNIREKDLVKCPCGAVEMLAEATEKIEKRTNGKTFNISSSGNMGCRKCGQEVFSSQEPVLLTNQTELKNNVITKPNRYAPIVEQHLQEFVVRPQLVSRGRDTALQVYLEGKPFSIDNDYIWLHYGRYLQDDLPIKGIIASNHSVRKGALYAHFAAEQAPDIYLFVTPYVSFRWPSIRFGMDTLSDSYSPDILRAFLLTHLNWQIQNSYADPNLLRWCSRVTRDLPVSDATTIDSLANITNIFRGHSLKRLAQDMSKGTDLTEDQELLISTLQTGTHHS